MRIDRKERRKDRREKKRRGKIDVIDSVNISLGRSA